MPKSFSALYVGMVLFIAAIVAISVNLTSVDFKSADAQKTTKFVVKNGNVDEEANKLVVVSKVNIENLSKTGIIKVVGEINGEDFINLSSNDYLGLVTEESLKKAAIQAIEKYGVGAGAVRTINGTLEIHIRLERKLA